MKYWLLTLLLMGSVVQAVDKGFTINGSIEAGFSEYLASENATRGWGKVSDFTAGIDDLNVRATWAVTDKTKVVLSENFAIGAGTNAGLSAFSGQFNSRSYFSTANVANNGHNFMLSLGDAYLEHRCTDSFYTTIGHFAVPFGMEGLTSRYDNHSYYYSEAYHYAASMYHWNWDTGLMFAFKETFPGAVEFALLDGRDNQVHAGETAPALGLATRLRYKWDLGGWAITPTASAYMARFRGGPKDLGFTMGFNAKGGMLWANMEWVYTSTGVLGADDKAKLWSVYIEPGVDLGLFDFGLKFDLASLTPAGGDGSSDMSLGAAIGKNYNGGYRIRLAYMHTGFQDKHGAVYRPANDIRLLFGTKW
ncbi:MAG: hypothetical protein HY537_06205 [Deltaproteobacteria bacterium]|nr:hypothetical protein [Deltaproteobacteria bacterium]